MKLIIEPCSNGAMLIEDDGENERRTVYLFDEENIGGLQGLLYDIRDFFNAGSKHDKIRVQINLEHGSNYECKGCDICGVGRD